MLSRASSQSLAEALLTEHKVTPLDMHKEMRLVQAAATVWVLAHQERPAIATKTRAKTKTTARAETASVVSTKYRERYAEHGGSSGDDIAVRLRKLLETDDGIDLAKLQALAQNNGVWEARYQRLNAGMQRMTVSNRLRALARKGVAIKWGVR
jgi:hypothetical protein